MLQLMQEQRHVVLGVWFGNADQVARKSYHVSGRKLEAERPKKQIDRSMTGCILEKHVAMSCIDRHSVSGCSRLRVCRRSSVRSRVSTGPYPDDVLGGILRSNL